jgi:hypothetical protein
MTKTLSVCAGLFEVTDERVFRRYQRKLEVGSMHSILRKDSNIQYLCLHLVPEMLIPGQKIPCQVQYDGLGASAIYPELVTAQLLMFFAI